MTDYQQTRGPGERPRKGQAMINGLDVRDMTDAQLRRRLGEDWGTDLMRDCLEGEARHRGLIE